MLLHHLLPATDGIPVLMYHRVWPAQQDGLTVTPEQFAAHLQFLKSKGYQPLHMRDFIDTAAGKRQRRSSDLLLTFDDGYRNNLTYAYPVLRETGSCATLFVIAGTLDNSYRETPAPIDEKLNVEEYRQMDPAIVQLALHGYHHENFSGIPPSGYAEVLQRSIAVFGQSALPYFKVLAYPYGARPGNKAALAALKTQLQAAGIEAAFRIGNKPERVPSADLYEIKRIDIRGEDDLRRLEIKLRKGKLKPF